MVACKKEAHNFPTTLVTAIITTYNRPDKLLIALQSVLVQTYPHIEIIIIDDHSTTCYAETLAQLPVSVRFIRLASNSGACAARNEGVRHAKGQYVAFLDDDDRWMPDKTIIQLHTIAQRDICLCGSKIVETGKLRVLNQKVITLHMLLDRNGICGSSGVFARRTALQDEPFDEQLSNSQDWDLLIRFAAKATIAYAAEPLYLFSDGDHDRITNKIKTMQVAELDTRLNALRKHRQLIGEVNYRRKAAGTILAYISERENKATYIKYCLQQVGVCTTMSYLLSKVLRKLGLGER